MNVVLISRTESKLQNVAREIRSECNVKVKLLTVDFADGPQVYDRIRKELARLEIGVLGKVFKKFLIIHGSKTN